MTGAVCVLEPAGARCCGADSEFKIDDETVQEGERTRAGHGGAYRTWISLVLGLAGLVTVLG